MSEAKEKREKIKKLRKELKDLRKDAIPNFLGVKTTKKKEKKKEENPLIANKPNAKSKYGKVHKLIIENPRSGIERYYFWILRFLQDTSAYGAGFEEVYKFKDVFDASASSSYFGNIEQRRTIQQDKASQYLQGISTMIKSMFQMVREIRVIEERLAYYKDEKSAETALKGTWIDLVEGGAKNPASVFGLSSQVGFTILPDLFFEISVPKNKEGKYDLDGVTKEVNKIKMDINRKMREVLSRKLFQFYTWKEKTEEELNTRLKFMLKYLKQHYTNIKLYISWVKPYLRNIKALGIKGDLKNPEIINAFETSSIELELLAKKTGYELEDDYGNVYPRKFKKKFPCIRVKMKYVAIPQMAFHQEYQKGPIHTGRTEITIEPYVLTDEEIKAYEKHLEDEDFELLTAVNESAEELKEEIQKYFDKYGEKFNLFKKKEEKKEEQKPEKEGLLTPFISIFKGFKEVLNIKGKPSKEDEEELTKEDIKQEGKIAEKAVEISSWIVYLVFKKAHGMLNA